jgi:hypothetical protein
LTRYRWAVSTPAERLVQAREAAGLATAREAADRTGVPYYTYVQHESGVRGITKDKAAVYGRAFGVEPSWLLYGRGGRKRTRTVPLVGYVGAGAQAHLFETGQGPFEQVEATDAANENTVAAEIRGESLGALFDRWLVFYDDVRSPVTPDLYGKLCVVGLPDGRVLVKQLKRAPEGRFHLISNTEGPLLDQEVSWAAKVTEMRPR